MKLFLMLAAVLALTVSCSRQDWAAPGSSGASAVIKIRSDKDFADKVKSNQGLVLVDFYADWCGPCRRLAPIVEGIAREQQDSGLTVARLNVDDHEALARQYGATSIPLLVLMKNGQVVDKRVGYAGKADLVGWIEKNR